MREDATEMRRRAQRTADISTQFERNQAGGKRCCRAARRPAGTARRVPRIVGGAVNLVVAPKVGQVQRYVGLPRMTAPAFFRRCTTRASAAGYQRQNCGSPQLVGMPTTLNCSLTVIGKPSSGRRSPFARAASAAAAASRARSQRASKGWARPLYAAGPRDRQERTVLAQRGSASHGLRATDAARSDAADLRGVQPGHGPGQ